MKGTPQTRGLVIAGLAVLVEVLVAGCGGPPASTTSGPPAVTPSMSATPVIATVAPGPTPTPTPTAGPTSTPADQAWTGLRWAAPALMAPLESVADVVAYDGGFVAVGQLQTAKGNEAAAWVSTDWRTWTRTFLDVPPAGNSTLWHVLPTGSGLVSIGSSGVLHCVPPEGEGQVCDPLPIALWTSADGRAWAQVPTPAVLASASIASVAAGPSDIVIVGDTGWDEPGIWTSTDGVAWHRETLPPALFAKAHLLGIAAARGGWVLTGFTGGSKPVCCAGGPSATTPAAWFSSDRVSWQAARVDGARQATGEEIGSVLVGRDGLVAEGGPSKSSNGWISSDGRCWSPRPESNGDPVGALAADGLRILGESYVSGNRLALWVSTDGAAWQPLAADGAVDQVPGWPGAATWARAAFLFPTGVGFVGENGTDRFPLWFAEAEGGTPIASSFTIPPDSALPAIVLDAYLQALRAGDCGAAHALVTSTFRKGNGELCGDAHVSAFTVTGSATPSSDEVVFATSLTSSGSNDGSLRAGDITWFYSLDRQPNGAWRITGGGTGP